MSSVPSAPAAATKLGFSVEPVTESTRAKLNLSRGGVQIARIFQPALGQMGVKQGDVILEVGKSPVNSVADFDKALSAFKSGDRVRLLIQNAESTGIIVLAMP